MVEMILTADPDALFKGRLCVFVCGFEVDVAVTCMHKLSHAVMDVVNTAEGSEKNVSRSNCFFLYIKEFSIRNAGR